MDEQPAPLDSDPSTSDRAPKKRKKFVSRLLIVVRRAHLYAGLFLLPWVFLYGITGAMFNHQGLLPEAEIQNVDPKTLSGSSLDDFPALDELANQVVSAIQSAAPDQRISLDASHAPELTGDVILQVSESGKKHAVHIDPVSKTGWVASFPKNEEELKPLLKDIRNVQIEPNPQQLVKQVVPDILSDIGLDPKLPSKPLGYTKLNFVATVDDVPARITYVLRDGHVDITQFTGEDGNTFRHFFLRLHTSHGQPPHWNGRMIWSVFVDIMAIAMVSWGVTGLVMWWQIKRTRLVGGIVIGLSVATAALLYMSMLHFYATTRL